MSIAITNIGALPRRLCPLLLLALVAWAGWAGAAEALEWPRFRGPNGSGVGAGGGYPVHFNPASNVLWKVALPAGHGSPCVADRLLFLTGFTNGNLETLALGRDNGNLVWRQSVRPDKLEKTSRTGGPAVSTPATDGRRVYVYFGSVGLVCYDLAGKEIWRKPLPIPITQHGAGTSPVLAEDRLILVCDQDVDASLMAVNPLDGQTLWRTRRPDVRRGFATPMVWREAGRSLLIVPGTLRVAAYRLQDGGEEWTVRGLPNEMCASPVAGSGLIYVGGWTHGSGVSQLPTYDGLLERGDANHDGRLAQAEAPGGPARQHFAYIDADKDGFMTRSEWDSMADIFSKAQNALLAIRPGGQGDVTDTHVVWKQTRGLPYVPSPLYYRDRIWLVKNGGLISCFNATNGVALFQEERLGALGDYYASPVAAQGHLWVASQAGVITVLAAADTLQVLARNELREEILATPALAAGRIYLRTVKHLYAFHLPPPLPKAGP